MSIAKVTAYGLDFSGRFVIVLNERHLATLLAEFVHDYNHDRPHRTLEQETPVPSPPTSGGGVVSRSILGRLHHAYARAA